MLKAEGIYGTLIMSYPFSWLMSHLYDLLPSLPWYSLLLAFLIAIHFYLIAQYIRKQNSVLQKAIIFIFSLLWLTYLWLNASITTLTVVTVIGAVGLIPFSLRLSLLFLALASLLRTNIMLMLLPYYAVAYFMLRDTYLPSKKERTGIIFLLLLLLASFYIQKQDRQYNDWLAFNKARSAIVDIGVMHIPKSSYTQTEQFCINASWFQDPTLLPTDRVIAATPTLVDILRAKLHLEALIQSIKHHKFKYWIWLLLAGSLVSLFVPYQRKKILLIPLLVGGIFMLLLIRDVERVTLPLMVLWAYLIYENLRRYLVPGTLFMSLFTWILFHYYLPPLPKEQYILENRALKQEAAALLRTSRKSCDISVIFPTLWTGYLNTVLKANYLFRESDWLPINEQAILPSGWMARDTLFYRTHHISDTYTKREHPDYHAFLVDDSTAFFGSNVPNHSQSFKRHLLKVYDDLYLKERPQCRHRTRLVATSKHFVISQIYIDCNTTRHNSENVSP